MRLIVLTTSIVFLVAGTTSAFSVGWGSRGMGRFGFSERGRFGHVSVDHSYGENGSDPNGSDKNGSHERGWHKDGFGFFGHGWHGGFGWGHFYGGDPKGRVEEKFGDLMETYDSGIVEIEDFFASDEYAGVIEDLEWLIGKHDWYLEHAEDKVDRLSDLISRFEDKLLSYQENWDLDKWGNLPDKHQEWIEKWLGAKEDWLTYVIDSLNEKQSNLRDKLDMHTLLNDDLNMYLEEILGAGGMTGEVAEVLEMNELVTVASSSLSLAPLPANSGVVDFVVPEPSTFALAALGLLGMGWRRRKRA